MKSVILFVFLVAACVSAEDTVKYAGTTAGGANFATPSFDSSSGACTASSSQSPYVYFNVTFATAGIREVAAMAERSYKGSITIYVYSGSFDPATPCANVIGDKLSQQTGLSGGPVIDDYVQFGAGIYFFIVTSSGSTGGLFAVNIFPSIASGQLADGAGSVWWAYPTFGSQGDCTSDPGSATPAGWFTWTQPTSGFFDILVSFANQTLTYSFGATSVLFQGTPSADGLIEDPCNNTATGATVITGNKADKRGVLIAYANLTAGWNYTIAFSSGQSGYTAYWGVQVVPTRLRFFKTSAFVQPERGFDPTDPTSVCTASDDDDASWDSTLFLTEERAYLVDTSTVPEPYSYVDTYSFLYKGDNTGSEANPPSACPIFAPLANLGDTGDITPVFALTDPGVNYTVVVSTYSGSQVDDPLAAYLLYLFTGLPIGALPPSTTGVPTTTGDAATTSSPTGSGTPTTSGAATGTPTTGAATGTPTTATASGSSTTASSSTTNQPVTTTSGASSVVVGFVAVVAVFATIL